MGKKVVAFQGESGAYSEQGARQFFGNDVETFPCRNFAGIFGAIHSQKATHGILPVENSLAGTVVPAYDQLIDQDLRIQGETLVRVQHCLLAPPGTALEQIKQAKSHPQALAQCENGLKRLGIEPVTHYDTAGAARDLSQNPEPGAAAIASRLAAEKYGMEILLEGIEDNPANFTRMVVLGAQDAPRQDPSKSAIVFTTRHVPGALHAVLGELASHQLNLTKIESRPRSNRPWHYFFIVEFDGHESEPAVQEALLGILKKSTFLKVLGSYPKAREEEELNQP